MHRLRLQACSVVCSPNRDRVFFLLLTVFYVEIPFPSSIDHGCPRLALTLAHSVLFPSAAPSATLLNFLFSPDLETVSQSCPSPHQRVQCAIPGSALVLGSQRSALSLKTLGSIWPPPSKALSSSSYFSYKVGFSPALPSFDLPFDLPYPVPPAHTFYPSQSRPTVLAWD